jgi:hypothetical protein
MQNTSTQSAPTQSTPAQSAPTQSAPAQSTPAQSAPTQSTAASPPPPRVVSKTPQQAVQNYFTELQAANGAALCDVLDARAQRALIEKFVQTRPTEAGNTCAQTMTNLAASVTNPSEHRIRLPALQVTRTGNGAVVRYVGPVSHATRTFTLVKRGSGWLIDKINGQG